MSKIEKAARAAMAKYNLHPIEEPMGDGHHTDAKFTQQDKELAELSYWLGGIFIDKEHIDPETPYKKTYYYNEMCSNDIWMRVARALRIHGLMIVDAVEQTHHSANVGPQPGEA